MAMKNIRLMLVDDHEVVRTGLRTFLETQTGLEVVGEANNGQTALELAKEVKPDVVVMDISMPDMDGLETTRQLLVTTPDCKVLALTVHADKQYFFEMLAAGAVGYVTKQAAADDLVSAIRSVAEGNVYLQPALAMWLLEDYRRLAAQDLSEALIESRDEQAHKDLESLSERERQVVELVADGLTNNEIGEALGISPKTVARHRERIMSKLDLHSCAELVKFAIRTGLIDLS
jgi:two-component system response regulator NreC